MKGKEVYQAMHSHFLDQFPPGVLVCLVAILMVLFIEVGFRIGRRPQAKPAKAQHSQVRAVMGAALGLTAFMLAFTFATAQSHYEARVQVMLQETRVANDAFLQAEFMAEPGRGEARRLLRRYLNDRLAIHDFAKQGKMEELLPLVEDAEQLQRALWQLAVQSARMDVREGANTQLRDPFMQSVVDLMDLHAARMEASMLNRIPNVIWVTLYTTGVLAMLIMGYQAGLVGKRSPFATVTLAASFAGVMMLITDLDRPFMTLFDIDDTVVRNTVARMDLMLTSEPAIGNLSGTSWQLVEIASMDDSTSKPEDSSLYSLEFKADGSASMQADCNRGTGSWTSESNGQLQFGPVAATRAMCAPGSLSDEYLAQFQWVRSYVLNNGHLFLATMADGAILEFQPQ